MRPDGLLRLQREANKGGSAVMQVYNGKTVTTTLTANGNATFAGDLKTGTWNNTSPTSSGTYISAGGNIIIQREAAEEDAAVVLSGVKGTTRNWLITNGGSASFAGNVTAKNISAFSVVLKAAVRNSTTFDELKTAIIEALLELVPSPPDVSTMPSPD